MASLLETGYVVRQGDGYRIRLKLREGQLWLNGRPAGLGGLPPPGVPSDERDSMALAFPR